MISRVRSALIGRLTQRRTRLTAAVAVAGWLVFSAGASAAVNLCVPSTAGAAVTSGGSTGTCATGTAVALPSSSVDQQTLISILPYIRYSASGVGGKPTVKFSGVNVQVLSGSGLTAGAVNGTGNLVVGHNEGTGSTTGSHNLVLGRDQSYSSYGALLAGRANVAGPYGAAFGYDNRATGIYSTVTGGRANTASSSFGAVSGGFANRATTPYASVSGGCRNLAGVGTAIIYDAYCYTSGYFPTVSGGVINQAIGTLSSVSGGERNKASGYYSSVSGGGTNTASGTASSVSGGSSNTADGSHSSILGDLRKTLLLNYDMYPVGP